MRGVVEEGEEDEAGASLTSRSVWFLDFREMGAMQLLQPGPDLLSWLYAWRLLLQ